MHRKTRRSRPYRVAPMSTAVHLITRGAALGAASLMVLP